MTTEITHIQVGNPHSNRPLELIEQLIKCLCSAQLASDAPPSKEVLLRLLQGTASEPKEAITFAHAVEASIEARNYRRPSTLADLRSYAARIVKLSQWANRDIRSISRLECRQLINTHFSRSAHIFGKAKTILHSIFAYALRQGWCDINPVDCIESHPIREETVNILTIKQIRAILKATAAKDLQDMDAAMRLMLWCGVRPGEVQRLRWRDIDKREKVVYIDGTASKTGGARAIPLRGGAGKLKLYDGEPNAYIAPRNWLRQWVKLRRRAGFRHWQKDALRHTFASYHLKYFHNIYLLQEEMGHRDATLLRTRYLNLRNITTNAASTFFKME